MYYGVCTYRIYTIPYIEKYVCLIHVLLCSSSHP